MLHPGPGQTHQAAPAAQDRPAGGSAVRRFAQRGGCVPVTVQILVPQQQRRRPAEAEPSPGLSKLREGGREGMGEEVMPAAQPPARGPSVARRRRSRATPEPPRDPSRGRDPAPPPGVDPNGQGARTGSRRRPARNAAFAGSGRWARARASADAARPPRASAAAQGAGRGAGARLGRRPRPSAARIAGRQPGGTQSNRSRPGPSTTGRCGPARAHARSA